MADIMQKRQQQSGDQTKQSVKLLPGRGIRSGVIVKNCDCAKRNGLSVDCHCENTCPPTQVRTPTPTPTPTHGNQVQKKCLPQTMTPTSPRIMKSCYERQQERMGQTMRQENSAEMAQFIPPTNCNPCTPPTFKSAQALSPLQMKELQEMLQNTEPINRVTPGRTCQNQHTTPFRNMPAANYITNQCECPPGHGDGNQLRNMPDPGSKICPPVYQTMHNQAQMQVQNQAQVQPMVNASGGQPIYQMKSIPKPGTYQHVQPLCQCAGIPPTEASAAGSRPLPCSEHRYDIPCSYCMQQF